MHAIFLDRDGVICENRADHVKNWNEFEFLPGIFDAFRVLATLGIPVIIVTNQAIVNRGLATVEEVEAIHERMVKSIQIQGGRVDAVYYCPHRPDENCDCRKPNAGMLLQAAEDFNLDLRKSYLIGDAKTDIQAGQTVGCKSFLVLTGRGLEQLNDCINSAQESFEVLFDLEAAIRCIQDLENFGTSVTNASSVTFDAPLSNPRVAFG